MTDTTRASRRSPCSPASGRTSLRGGSHDSRASGGYDGLEIAPAGATTSTSVVPRPTRLTWPDRRRPRTQRPAGLDHREPPRRPGRLRRPIDQRHEDIVPPHVWGDGDPEGVRSAPRRSSSGPRGRPPRSAPTPSPVLRVVHLEDGRGLPPVPPGMVDAGYQDFHDRWSPILDVFEDAGCASRSRCTRPRSRTTTTGRPSARSRSSRTAGVRVQLRPVALRLAGPRPAAFLLDFADRVYHVHCKESVKQLDGRNGRLGSHLPWATPPRVGTSSPPGTGTSVGAGVPRAEPHRVHGAHECRVGGRRDGPARRRAGGAGLRPAARTIAPRRPPSTRRSPGRV